MRPVTSRGLAPGFKIEKSGAGSCGATSDLQSWGAFYRCNTGHLILDPCWINPRYGDGRHVVCLERPWQTTLIALHLPRHIYGVSKPRPIRYGHPWGVQLTSGERCIALQGAHDAYKGRAVDFMCEKSTLLLLRGLNRSSGRWTADSVIHDRPKPYYRRGPKVSIATAWYADGRRL